MSLCVFIAGNTGYGRYIHSGHFGYIEQYHWLQQTDIAFQEILMLQLYNAFHNTEHGIFSLFHGVYKPFCAAQCAFHILAGSTVFAADLAG